MLLLAPRPWVTVSSACRQTPLRPLVATQLAAVMTVMGSMKTPEQVVPPLSTCTRYGSLTTEEGGTYTGEPGRVGRRGGRGDKFLGSR